MTALQKIAVFGKGLLGSAFVQEFTRVGFTVTVFTRNASTLKGLPAGVDVAQVDYSSIDSVTAALRGHDVAISALGFEALQGQKLLIDASIRAGVRRYIPCDWTTLSTDPRAQAEVPILAPLVDVQTYLAEKAAAGVLEYTIFSVGVFFDSILTDSLVVDFANHAASLYDNGQQPISVTTVQTVAKAVAAALQRPEATKNRNLFVHDRTVTQAQLLDWGKKYTPGVAWTVAHVESRRQFETSKAEILKQGPHAGAETVFRLLAAATFLGQFHAAYDSVDNEMLGLGFLSEADLEAKVAVLYNQGAE